VDAQPQPQPMHGYSSAMAPPPPFVASFGYGGVPPPLPPPGTHTLYGPPPPFAVPAPYAQMPAWGVPGPVLAPPPPVAPAVALAAPAPVQAPSALGRLLDGLRGAGGAGAAAGSSVPPPGVGFAAEPERTRGGEVVVTLAPVVPPLTPGAPGVAALPEHPARSGPACGAATDFGDLLGRRDGAPVNALYARQRFRCAECALRFPEPAELAAHARAHAAALAVVAAARASAGALLLLSREWLLGEDAWVAAGAGGGAGLDPAPAAAAAAAATAAAAAAAATAAVDGADAASVTSESEHVVLALDMAATCPVCGEGFSRKWDEDEEAFVFKGAVRGADGDVLHTLCASTLDPAAAAAAVAAGALN